MDWGSYCFEVCEVIPLIKFRCNGNGNNNGCNSRDPIVTTYDTLYAEGQRLQLLQ